MQSQAEHAVEGASQLSAMSPAGGKRGRAVSPSGLSKAISLRSGTSRGTAGGGKLATGMKAEVIRRILKESFLLFREIDLPDHKLKDLEDIVFANSFILSPRTAAKAILEVMDSSL